MQKYSSKLSHLTFPSNPQTRTNTLQLSHSYLRSSRNSDCFADKSMRFQATVNENAGGESCKVIKLIGDKENNIEEIIAQVNCLCGSKKQIRSILSLLMSKIYSLREERNSLKTQLQSCQTEISKLKNKNTVGVNTDNNFALPKHTVEQFLGSQRGENDQGDTSGNKVQFQKLQQLFKTEGVESLTFQRDFNETNLLEESEVKMNANSDEESLLQLCDYGSNGKKVLGQHNQGENRLKSFSQFLKVNKFDLNTLQSYIQKINCAKQIGKYELKRRNKDLF